MTGNKHRNEGEIRLSSCYYDLARTAEPQTRPGPGLDCWGRRRRALGTLGEELQRGIWGEPPQPLTSYFLRRFVVALARDPELRQTLHRLILGREA
jgi:hypothetical protein